MKRLIRFFQLMADYERHRRDFGSRFPEAKFNTFWESWGIHWQNSRWVE